MNSRSHNDKKGRKQRKGVSVGRNGFSKERRIEQPPPRPKEKRKERKKEKKIKCENREEKAQDDMKIDGIHCLSFIKR